MESLSWVTERLLDSNGTCIPSMLQCQVKMGTPTKLGPPSPFLGTPCPNFHKYGEPPNYGPSSPFLSYFGDPPMPKLIINMEIPQEFWGPPDMDMILMIFDLYSYLAHIAITIPIHFLFFQSSAWLYMDTSLMKVII